MYEEDYLIGAELIRKLRSLRKNRRKWKMKRD